MNKDHRQQGDVIYRKIDSLPTGVKEVPRKEGKIIVMHGEGVEGDTVQEALNFRAKSILKAGENWGPSVLT